MILIQLNPQIKRASFTGVITQEVNQGGQVFHLTGIIQKQESEVGGAVIWKMNHLPDSMVGTGGGFDNGGKAPRWIDKGRSNRAHVGGIPECEQLDLIQANGLLAMKEQGGKVVPGQGSNVYFAISRKY